MRTEGGPEIIQRGKKLSLPPIPFTLMDTEFPPCRREKYHGLMEPGWSQREGKELTENEVVNNQQAVVGLRVREWQPDLGGDPAFQSSKVPGSLRCGACAPPGPCLASCCQRPHRAVLGEGDGLETGGSLFKFQAPCGAPAAFAP